MPRGEDGGRGCKLNVKTGSPKELGNPLLGVLRDLARLLM